MAENQAYHPAIFFNTGIFRPHIPQSVTIPVSPVHTLFIENLGKIKTTTTIIIILEQFIMR